MANTNPGGWTTVIRARRGWFDLRLGEVARYRDLILLLVKRDFTVMYKQTILGPAWAIIQPLLTTVIFTVVFGNIAALPTDSMPPFLFYMCGNIAWHYFSGCLTNTSITFAKNAKLFGKVYFPRLCMPISTVLSQLINFSIQFGLFLIFLIYYATKPNPVVHPNWQLILLTPLMLVQMAMLSLGFGIIVSALTTKYRDLAMLVEFGVHLWMYATPVTYPASMILDKYPRLITAEIGAFSEHGRENEPAFDAIIQAASGVLECTGEPESPSKVGFSMTDVASGLFLVQGIMFALYDRDVHSGKGQNVDVRMQDAAIGKVAVTGLQRKFFSGDPYLDAAVCDDDEFKLVMPMIRDADDRQVIVEESDREPGCPIGQQFLPVFIDPVC